MGRPWALLATLLLPLAAGEALAQPHEGTGFAIDRFGVDEGLPGNYITDLAQTGDGLLQVLASGWLFHFDGVEFERSDLRGLSSAPDERVIALGAGRGDTLWAVTAGATLVSYRAGRTRLHATHDQPLYDVWQDGGGQVWARDGWGLWRLERDGLHQALDNPMPWVTWRGARQRDQVLVDPAARQLWARHGDGLLLKLQGDSVLSRTPFPFPALIVQPSRGRALGTRSVGPLVEVVDEAGTVLARFPDSGDRIPRLLDRRGLLWTTSPGRIEAFGLRGRRVAALPLDRGAAAADMLEDREGNLWIGTETEGLYRVRQLPVRALGSSEGLTDGQVYRVSEGGGGGVLVLDAEGRVTRVGPEGVDTLLHPTPTSWATAALVAGDGTLWLATVLEGTPTLVASRARAAPVAVPLPFTPERIVEDRTHGGRLWLVGWGGVTRVRVRAGEPVVGEPMLGDWGLREIMIDRRGGAWVGGAAGVARITERGVERFRGDAYPTFRARSFHEDEQGGVWIGRYFGGLVRYRGGEFREVGSRDGLADDVVSSILEDGRGNLWMGSNRGVHRVALGELNDLLDGRTDHVHGRDYGREAGFANPESSGWHGHRTPDGRLWFPTFGGMVVIDPETALALEAAPAVRIRALRAGGAALERDGLPTLPKGVRTLEVAFGAVVLSDPGSVRYEVQLEGVDPGWVRVGGQRQVSYGNLEPGPQLLRIRAVTGAYPAHAGETALAFLVPPLFQETPAFYLLLSALLALAGLAAHQLGVRGLRARQAALARLVAERTEQLGSEKARAEEALTRVAAQAEELRSLGEARSLLFTNLSHELRTPLTLVQGPLQDLLDGRLGPLPDAVKADLEGVLSNGRRLGELVQQLLDVARLEAGELRPVRELMDVAHLFRRLAVSFEVLARRKGSTFEAVLPLEAVWVAVARDHLEKICTNLLANAVAFTPPGGRIRFVVRVEEEAGDDLLVVSVEDDGPGIPADHREKVFERFHQVDADDHRLHGGVGLGLALVKEITELYGGEVSLWSEEGRGSRFTVRIPARSSAPHQGVTNGGSAPSVPKPRRRAGAPRASQERPTILVVEDHDELRNYLRRHLEEEYRVLEAGDGREGLEVARAVVPDLVLADVMMPAMDGMELLAAIRSDPELAFLPVVLLTAKGSRENTLQGLVGGADDYLVKPFDPAELKLRIDNLLGARRRLRERLLEDGRTLPSLSVSACPSGENGANGDGFAGALQAFVLERLGDENLDVSAIARGMAMSRATLYRRTEEALGLPPMDLLWSLRLEQAWHWLLETDATVSEVAYAAGFKSVPHFTRRFRERYGDTPAAFRNAAPARSNPGP